MSESFAKIEKLAGYSKHSKDSGNDLSHICKRFRHSKDSNLVNLLNNFHIC